MAITPLPIKLENEFKNKFNAKCAREHFIVPFDLSEY